MSRNVLLLLVPVLALTSCTSEADRGSPVPSLVSFSGTALDDYKPVHKLVGLSTEPLGTVYVKQITDDVFTSLLIKREENGVSELLYVVDGTSFVGKSGLETEVVGEGFFGYKMVLAKNDYIVLSYLTNDGKGVSDDITIKWDYDQKRFSLQKTP